MQIEVAEKRRKIDDLCSHIIVQTERIYELTKEESIQWLIQDNCRKLKTSLDQGAILGTELLNICNSIHQNVQFSMNQVTDQDTLKSYQQK